MAPRLIELTTKVDARGALTVVGHDEIPFSIARVFYTYGMPPGVVRGGHAHRATEQFLVAVSGAFSVDLTDGHDTSTFRLDSPTQGVYVPPMVWDRLYDFSPNAVCLVFASTPYAESDYVRDWDSFLREKTGRQ